MRHEQDLFLLSEMSVAESRRIQRLAKDGQLLRIAKGVYLRNADKPEIELLVRQNWQRIAGKLVPGGVVSHISAISGNISADKTIVISHPTRYGKKIFLPGLTFILLRGPKCLPYDLALGQSGLHWSGRTRMLLENIGKLSPNRAGAQGVEKFLITVLNTSGEKALNDIRDQALKIGPYLGATKEVLKINGLIGGLLGTRPAEKLKTKDGKLVARLTPVDKERICRFELLASHLRTTPFPHIPERYQAGLARQHWAFVESYFSNYVEGTKFSVEQARSIVMSNKLVTHRPQDSHDILGVFRLALNTPFRDTPPAVGTSFIEGLAQRHLEMMRMRPEINPGHIKISDNFAGTTQFVGPNFVRGTLSEGSQIAMSVPEGVARAIYYAFLISEIHPFEDGNGRLSRLVMNSELSRVGLSRIIIPTLFHPQYVDCARALSRNNEPGGFINSLTKMMVWCNQFDYSDLEALIASLKKTNAFEEPPSEFKLLDLQPKFTQELHPANSA
jgi:Fic/DOC family